MVRKKEKPPYACAILQAVQRAASKELMSMVRRVEQDSGDADRFVGTQADPLAV